jgi:hypothetical protein
MTDSELSAAVDAKIASPRDSVEAPPETVKRIDSLTPEQEAMLPVYRDKWLAIGLDLEDYSLTDEELRRLVDKVYTVVDLAPPEQIIRVKSPLQLQAEANRLLGHDKPQWVDVCFGNQDANWLGFYEFFIEVYNLELDKIRPLIELSKRVGWFVPLDGACIVSQRLTVCRRNSRGALHCVDGPAVLYEDGYAVYAVNGVRFSPELARQFILTPKAQIDRAQVLKIENVEQRSEIIELIGVGQFLHDLAAETIDTDTIDLATADISDAKMWRTKSTKETYKLLKVVVGITDQYYLQMQNPSVPETHVEAVHPDCRTVKQALHWRNTGEVEGEFLAPSVLT